MSRDAQRLRKTYSYHNVQPKITSLEIIVDETLDFKHSVRATTTSGSPVAFSGTTPTIIDGITLADEDRVLLKDQASASQNGIYYYEVSSDGGSYSFVRASDARQGTLDSGAFTYVEEGNIGEKTSWVLTTKNPIIIDVTDLTWELFGATGGSVASIFTTQGSKARTTYSTSFDSNNRYVDSIGSDVVFFVSGSSTHKAVFGGDIVGSGSLVVNGSVRSTSLTGSLTNIADGTSYLVAGSGITISTGSNGAVTITNNGTVGDITAVTAGTGLSGGGTSGAVTLNLSNTGSAGTYGSATQVPVFSADAQGRVASVTNTSIQIAESQVTSLTTDLGNRALTSTTITAGTGLSGGGDLSASRTLSINNAIVATVSGTTFTGITKHNSGLSGSLTKLTDGTSYLIAGGNVTVATGSNGSVTFATINSGTIHGVTAGTGLTGGGTSGAVTLNLSNTGSAGTYGSATQVPVFSADAQGRVASVTNTSIQIAESQVTSLTTDLGNRALTSTTITAGTGLSGGGDLSASRTLSIDNSVVATISGSTFTGAVKFNAGLSGSLTQSGATAGSVFFAGTGGVLSQNNSNLFWDNTAARLGIGTATSDNRFNVYTTSANGVDGLRVFGGTTTRNVRLRPAMSAGANNSIVAAGDSGIIFDAGVVDTGAFVIAPWASSTSGLRMTSAGDVGIGTASPGARLQVSGSSTGTTTTLLARHGVANGSNLPVLDVQNSAGTSLLFVSGSGDVGIGTTTTDGARLKLYIPDSSGPTVGLLIHSGTLGTGGNSGVAYNASTLATFLYSNGNTSLLAIKGIRHTAGSGWTSAATRIQQVTDSTSQAYIDFNPAGSTGQSAMAFGTLNFERMRIDTNGNVGIGNTAPQALLHVAGGRIIAQAVDQYAIQLQQGATVGGLIGAPAASEIGFYTADGTERARIDSSGNVGIGTSASSTNKLHVYKSGASAYSVIQSSNANSYLNLLGTYNSNAMSGTIGVENGMMSLGTSTNHPLVIGTSGSEQVRITSGGSVGIGTSTITAAKLHVQGSSTGTDTTLLVRHNVTNGSNLPVVDVQNSGGNSLFHISGSGDVGIGTQAVEGTSFTVFRNNKDATMLTYGIGTKDGNNVTSGYYFAAFNPSGPIVRVGSLYINQTGNTELSYSTTETGKSLRFLTGGSSSTPTVGMVLTADNGVAGKVGIGTTNPLQKLQLGSNTSSSTESPDTISLGATYSSTAGSNTKLRLYDDGAGTVSGIGVSLGKMDYCVPAGNSHAWYIGGVAKISLGAGGAFNTNNLYPNADNTYYCGFSGYGTIAWAAVNSWSYPSLSDYRTKKNITSLTGSLGMLINLNPVSYEYNDYIKNPEKLGTRVGFIAHEMQEIFPNLVSGSKDAVSDDGSIITQSICQDDLIPYIVDAIKQLKAENEELRQEIKTLKLNLS